MEDDEFMFDIGFFSILAFSIAVHICLLLKSSISNLIKYFKAKCLKRCRRKNTKQASTNIEQESNLVAVKTKKSKSSNVSKSLAPLDSSLSRSTILVDDSRTPQLSEIAEEVEEDEKSSKGSKLLQ